MAFGPTFNPTSGHSPGSSSAPHSAVLIPGSASAPHSAVHNPAALPLPHSVLLGLRRLQLAIIDLALQHILCVASGDDALLIFRALFQRFIFLEVYVLISGLLNSLACFQKLYFSFCHTVK